MTARHHSQTAIAHKAGRAGHIHSRRTRASEPESARAASSVRSFAESPLDQIDPDLRHRIISEAAYHLYEERGFADGYDFDDWLQAEADVERQLLEVSPNKGPTSPA